jgi:hypothetical protein
VVCLLLLSSIVGLREREVALGGAADVHEGPAKVLGVRLRA